jgi:hypothetical protein
MAAWRRAREVNAGDARVRGDREGERLEAKRRGLVGRHGCMPAWPNGVLAGKAKEAVPARA